MDKDITINDISLKAKSKKEVYPVLTTEGGLYLPPIEDANINYLKGIITWQKKFLYWKKVLTINVPHIKSLIIKDILKFARENSNIDDYLPTYEYNKHLNRV